MKYKIFVKVRLKSLTKIEDSISLLFLFMLEK